MIETIYEDDDIVVSHSANGSDVAVLSYSPMNHNIAAKGIPALAALRGAGLDVFGVMARKNNWYPSLNMRVAARRLECLLPRYRRRIGYGSSMGAYAALKYSALLGCDHVLALAPQYSIDPVQVGRWDTRFTRHFDSNRHDQMAISPEDLGKNAIIVVDPTMRADLRHASLIEAAASFPNQINQVRAWHCGHTVINPIASRATLESLFKAVLADDLDRVRQIYRAARKSSPYFHACLFEALAQRRLKQGRLDIALYAANEAVGFFDKIASFHITKSRVHSVRNEHAQAYEHALRALEIEPGNGTATRLVSELTAK